MPKCRDNRRKTARRRSRGYDQLLAKTIQMLWPSMCPDGKNPDYYEPYNVRLRGHGKWTRLAYKVRPNAKYRRLMLELAEKCKGITVDLSGMKDFQERHQWN